MPKRGKSKTPDSTWSVSDLKEYIRKRTSEVNEQIRDYEKLHFKGTSGWRFRQSVQKLQKAATGKIRRDMSVPMKLNKAKNKLVEQAKELMRFGKRASTKKIKEHIKSIKDVTLFKQSPGDVNEKTDVSNWSKLSDEEKKELYEEWRKEEEKEDKDKHDRAFDTFKDRYDQDITREEYDDLVDTFSLVGYMLESYGYKDRQGNEIPEENAIIAGNLQDFSKKYEPEEIYYAMRMVLDEREKDGGKGWDTKEAITLLDAKLKELFD